MTGKARRPAPRRAQARKAPARRASARRPPARRARTPRAKARQRLLTPRRLAGVLLTIAVLVVGACSASQPKKVAAPTTSASPTPTPTPAPAPPPPVVWPL